MKRRLALLRLLLREEDRDEVLGDLEEGYLHRAERLGKRAASRWLWRQVLTVPVRLRLHALADGRSRVGAGGAGTGPLEDLLRDIRFGVRGLRRKPVFTLAAVVTLAIGAGMTTTMFTLVDAVILSPLPGTNAGGLVYLELESDDGRMSRSPTPELLRLIRDHADAFSRVEGYGIAQHTLTVDGELIRERGAQASERFFSFLGVTPQLGRTFLPGDGLATAAPVVVLSHTLWQERFGGSRQVLGRTMVIDGRTHVIVGVLARDFQVDTRSEALFWTPEGAAGEMFADGVSLEGALARLAHGITLEAATDELNALVANNPLERTADLTWVGTVKTPAELVDPALKKALLFLQAGAVLVLLIACANLGSLLLAHGEGRTREFAVRASLGAGRGRLVRQLLTECVILGAFGAAGGVLLTVWALDALPFFLPPGYAGYALHAPGLAFAAGVSLLGILAAGLIPALRVSRGNLVGTIKGTPGQGSGSRRTLGVQRLLVGAQVAMAFMLLFSAGLLFKSFFGLITSDVGFRRDDLLSMRVGLPEEVSGDEQARVDFLERLGRALATGLPSQLGTATMATGLVDGLSAAVAPLAGEDREAAKGEDQLLLEWGVAPDFFQVVGLPLIAGRTFSGGGVATEEPEVVVNEDVARRYFTEGDAVGRLLWVGTKAYRVVGVAGTVRLPSLAQSRFGDLQLFLPLSEQATRDVTVFARIQGDRTAAATQLREVLRSVDSFLPVLDVSLVEDALAASLTQERSNAVLMILFAVTALILGAVGIYGVVAYAVGRQVREIGIRLALGSTEEGEVGRVLGAGMRTVGVGLVLGVGGALLLGSLLSGLLHQVSDRDPVVSATAALAVAGVAFVATWLPARRAARLHPSRALRAD